VAGGGEDPFFFQAVDDVGRIDVGKVGGGDGGVLVENGDVAEGLQLLMEEGGEFQDATLDFFRADFEELCERGIHGVEAREGGHAAFVFFSGIGEDGGAVVETVNVLPVLVAAPADDVWLERIAEFGGDVEEGGTVGTEEPFVTVDGDHGGLNLLDVESQGAEGLGGVDIEEDVAFFQERADLIQGRTEAGGVADLAHENGAGLGRDGVEKIGPFDFDEIDAFGFEEGGVVELIGELVGEGDDAVAGFPVLAAEEERQGGGGVEREGDVGSGGMDKLGGFGAGAVDVIEPIEEVRAGEFIAVVEVPVDGCGGGLGEKAVGGRVEVGPMGDGGVTATDGRPMRGHK